MIQKEKSCNTTYTSCIRINGIPILPPLITSNKKEKLLKYKEMALEVEARLRDRLHKNTVETQCTSVDLEHQFYPEVNSSLVLFENQDVPYKRSKDCFNLTCDLVEASEYSSSGIRFFNDKMNVIESCNESNSTIADDNWHEIKNFSSSYDEDFEKKAPPLIRSNSYTLESPSPLLLAHLKNMGLESSFGDEHTFQTLTSPDSEKSNFETDDKPFNEVERIEGALNTEDSEQICSDAVIESKNLDDQINQPESINEALTENLVTRQNSKNLESKTDFVITEVDVELLKALNKLAHNEKEQILLFLQSQQSEQNQPDSENALLNNPPQDHESNSSICSDTSSHSVKFPALALQGVVTQISETKIDIFDKTDNFLTQKSVSNTVVRNILNCSQNLFYEDDIWLQQQQRLKEEWAASVIVAHAKGYLTRRLMSTERVRNLIETIKDALICAMQLHSETTDVINESDVELHRRLVQQISAACYAFHDVFFSLSTAEQMAIIAHDRRRLKEKALKNLSLN